MKKISYRAFTIIEMIVVMILSAIVVGLTYMYFSQFQRYMKDSSDADNTFIRISALAFVMQKDLDEAVYIFMEKTGELKIIKEEEEILYHIDNEYFLRETETASDTFLLKTTNMDFIEMKKYNHLISRISFDAVTAKNKYMRFDFLKEYPSATLFNNFKEE